MKRIVLIFVFVFIGIVTAWAQALPFKDSGSVEGILRKVEVTGNDTIPVILICGTHVYFIVEFVALTAINGADVDLEGYFIYNGIPMLLPTNRESLGGGPSMMKYGDNVKYLIRLGIPKDYPAVNMLIRLILKNQASGNVIISFDLPVSIKEKDS